MLSAVPALHPDQHGRAGPLLQCDSPAGAGVNGPCRLGYGEQYQDSAQGEKARHRAR